MTSREQMAAVMARLEASYPDGTYGWRENPSVALDAWHDGLGEIPYELVFAAVRRWIATQPKLPHIADIRALIAAALDPVPSEGEAWRARFRYCRQEPREGDSFAFRVFASIDTPAGCGQMEERDLRQAFTWAYKSVAEAERQRRTAAVEDEARVAVAAAALGRLPA